MDIKDFLKLVRKSRIQKECGNEHNLMNGNLYSVTYYMLEKRIVKFVTVRMP